MLQTLSAKLKLEVTSEQKEMLRVASLAYRDALNFTSEVTYQMGSFLQESDLRNSQRGFGLQPTWPASLPSVLMIAIDHCLHSKSIKIINRATGSNIGSDHLPLLVAIAQV